MSYNYLFGPVPSRRLGRSLGIDLVPMKTCTMNCRFCQLGDSEEALCVRQEYVPTAVVLAELEQWLAADGGADHITLAGSGEPTLHTKFGDVLRWIGEHTSIPSVLLTNGSLLHLPEVRKAAALADKVKVTLSAWDETSFQRLHQPAPGVRFQDLLAGEQAFRREFFGELSVEIFLVAGVNSGAAAVEQLAALVATLRPDRIDLNTAVRPPADGEVKALSAQQMDALLPVFGEKAVVAASFPRHMETAKPLEPKAVVGLIQRHPASAEQLASDFGAALEPVRSMLTQLVSEGILQTDVRDDECYYFMRR